MFPLKAIPLFGITHPLGLPRPVDPENVFGAKIRFFAVNAMPVPTGCLEHFDEAVYRPYVTRLAAALARRESGWSGSETLADPPRYCLRRGGIPTDISAELEPLLPQPPLVSFAAVLSHFDHFHTCVPPAQLLDLLTLIREDMGSDKFSAAAATHPWVVEFMR